MAPSHRVLCLSSFLLPVGGGTDKLGIESTDPEKILEEHDFNNFLNYPSFSQKKVNWRVFLRPTLNRAVGQKPVVRWFSIKSAGSPGFHQFVSMGGLLRLTNRRGLWF
jgi:hypothetical protein